MMRSIFYASLFLLLSALSSVAFAGSGCASYDTALANCQSNVIGGKVGGLPVVDNCVPHHGPDASIALYNSGNFIIATVKNGGSIITEVAQPYSCPAGFNGNCPAMQGQALPSGATYDYYQSSGQACSNSCEMSLKVGSDLSTSYVYTGGQCGSTGTATKQGLVPPPPSETANADGSKTWCDPISGKCVTSNPGQQTVPPTTGDGNHSTDSSTQTSTSGSTSTTTSTSTSTTTGDGSGGSGGGGNSTTVTTGQSMTQNPASASSSATKCDTGVCDVGDADGDTGGLYQASTDTPGSVFAQFQAQVADAPIIAAATGFFTVNASGSCPTWHIPGNKYWGEAGFDFSFFCDSGILAILTAAGYVVLALAAFCAFRIAVY